MELILSFASWARTKCSTGTAVSSTANPLIVIAPNGRTKSAATITLQIIIRLIDCDKG